MDTSHEDFANIDDLLGEDIEDGEATKEEILNDEQKQTSYEFVTEEQEPDICDESFGHEEDHQNHLDDKVSAEEHPDTVAEVKDAKVKPGVFCSDILEDVLEKDAELVGSVKVPKSLAWKGFNITPAEIFEKISEQVERNEDGISAGLGQKKKTELKMRMKGRMMGASSVEDISSNRAKTLAEKRSKLREDILKYGVAAIEKLYPRQGSSHSGKRTGGSSSRKSGGSRNMTFKLKPVPHDTSCAEVDAWKILRPYSHDKYIKHPDNSPVVYIQRKHGLVPLSTLSRSSKNSSSSSSVKLLRRRNYNLGKPGHFVRDGERLIGVGGTRSIYNTDIKIHSLPTFERRRPNRMTPFLMDLEFAKIATETVQTVANPGKVDIRQLKRNEMLANVEMAKQLADKPLLEKMMFKMKQRDAPDEDLVPRDYFDSCMQSYKQKRKKDTENKDPKKEEGPNYDDFKSFNIGMKDKDYVNTTDDSNGDVKEESVNSTTVDDDVKDEVEEQKELIEDRVTVSNSWSSMPKNVVPQELNFDECPPLSGYSEGSIRNLVPKPVNINFDGYTGYDYCDVKDCIICRDSSDSKLDDSRNSVGLDIGTPGKSGSQTPSGSKQKPQRIAKDLQRVKRALKTLGVNIIEYDDGADLEDCMKEYCKLGCICDSLRTKQIPPSHCGKVECMFSCCCSKEALKYSSCGSRRVNISAAVGARIMEDTQRGMAAEERKFSNTVVLTADKDTVVLGGRGTRRERKVPQRYQNANTLMLDVAGKEYVQKEDESSESDDDTEDMEDIEDDYDKLRRSADLIPCTVIVPLVNLPSSTNIWCMYHAQYSCPCNKYKNPLDFAPDIEHGDISVSKADAEKLETVSKKRKVSQDSVESKGKSMAARMMVGPKSRMKKSKIEDEPLLGIEDIDPDYQKPVPSSVRHPLSAPAAQKLKMIQSARTKPMMMKQSLKTKLTVKQQKKTIKNSKIPELVKIIDDDDAEDDDVIEDNQDLQLSNELNLDIKDVSSVQYVRWDIIKSKFQTNDIDLYFWVRPGRGRNILFLTQSGAKPHIASAINLRNIQGSTHHLPSLVSDSINVVQERDKARYCILESNGSMWSITKLMAIKGQKDLGLSMETIESKMVKKKDPSNTESSKSNNQKDSSVKISLDQSVQKLPVGQSLITVVEGAGNKALMQVKLPPTLNNQYWSLISVGQGQSSIQCPDSNLVLKCAILQQAATLSTATSTTVRIPIPVADQDPSFGVYAVPGLKSHVFVGPFTAPKGDTEVEDDDDIVCLEDDDDDVKVVEPNKDAPVADATEDKQHEKDLKHEKLSKRNLLGQIPLVVTKSDDEDEVINVDESSEEPSASQAKDLKKNLTKDIEKDPEKIPTDLRPSEYGKIVQRQSKRSSESVATVDVQYKLMDEEKSYQGILESSGRVILTHPKYEDYEIICQNADNASNWLEEYFEDEVSLDDNDNDEEVIFDDPEPLPSAPPKVKSPPPILKRIKTPALASGKSTKKIALFVQLKQQKDEAQLFYELGHTAFSNFFNKNVTRAQILNKAKDEIKLLRDESKELDQTKQALMRRRTKLFELFTKSLNGLPVARKKAAVIDLKELLKRDKERKENENKPKEAAPATTISQSSSQSSTSTPYTDVTGINTKRSDGSVLRPMNAFMLWAKDKRSSLLAQGLGISQVSQVLSDNWKALSEEERSKFHKEAEHLKALHKIQHPDYKYAPKVSKQTSPGTDRTSTVQSQASIAPTIQTTASLSQSQQRDDQLEIIQLSPSPKPTSIQVPKPLPQLVGIGGSSSGINISKPSSILAPKSSRPAPALLPVNPVPQQSQMSSNKQSSQFEILNVPSRPNIKISSAYIPQSGSRSEQIQRENRRESVEIIQSCTPTQLTVRDQQQQPQPGVLNIQDISRDLLGLSPSRDVVGMGAERQNSQIINIGGESYLLPQEPLPNPQQKLVLSQEQAQLLLGHHQPQQIQDQPQLIIEQPQHQQQLQQDLLIDPSQDGQQYLIEPNQQHIFVDENGQQVILTPDQQLQLLQQVGDDGAGGQLVQIDDGAAGGQLMQIDELSDPSQMGLQQDHLVQLEGENGERVMLAFPDTDPGQLLFQTQE